MTGASRPQHSGGTEPLQGCMRLGWWGLEGWVRGGASLWASLAVGQRAGKGPWGGALGAAGGSACSGVPSEHRPDPPVSRWRPLLEMPNMVPRPGVGNLSLVSDRAR